MLLDIPEERGLAIADIRWGDPLECRFPLFSFLPVLPLQWMFMVYLVMWLGKQPVCYCVLKAKNLVENFHQY